MNGKPWPILLLALTHVLPAQDVVVTPLRPTDRPPSELLRPPTDAQSSTAPIDWANLPPWRQTSFYGLRAPGTFFVFVVDASGSMADPGRWLRLQQELHRTLARLQFPQRYLVIFFNDQAWPMPGRVPASASRDSIHRTLAWARRFQPQGATDPRAALAMALSFKPDAIFLLSDGEFPDGVANDLIQAHPNPRPIHCIDLSGNTSGDDLRRIAAHSGGRYSTP
ncbi:MAG: hypothetical protein KatS3mg108_2782 [Isosphaeraceae bacterium]|jgi:hypothetical protein|nr:MAG: hypothetical protein KatS3mg108_2782 [Isosphaeraceae bacterium]